MEGEKWEAKSRELRVDRGTTLRVVGFLLAEMRKQPGGSVYDVAMQRAESKEQRAKSCWLRVES